MKDLENTDSIALAFYLIIMLFSFEHEMEWNDFENEVIYKNRYMPNHKILDTINQKSKQATKKIRKGKKLFRARTYDYNYSEDLTKIVEQLNHLSKEEKDEITNSYKGTKNETIVGLLLSGALFRDEKQVQEYLKSEEDSLFKGYDKDNSTAPPADMVTEGRANPTHIRYLYLAEKYQTAIYEVRPIIKQQVSVALMEVKEDLKIYDLTIWIEEESSAEIKIEKESLFNVIGKAFAEPNHNKKELYIPTQYLAEYIKNLGFDGIKFNSSLHKGGKNILIFDPEKCEAVSSDKYEIENIKITINAKKSLD